MHTDKLESNFLTQSRPPSRTASPRGVRGWQRREGDETR